MSLEDWAKNGWLRPHKTTPREIADLLGIVDRDVKEAERATSDDWKFGIAYNAALKLCTNLNGMRRVIDLIDFRLTFAPCNRFHLSSVPNGRVTPDTSTGAAKSAIQLSMNPPASLPKLKQKS